MQRHTTHSLTHILSDLMHTHTLFFSRSQTNALCHKLSLSFPAACIRYHVFSLVSALVSEPSWAGSAHFRWHCIVWKIKQSAVFLWSWTFGLSHAAQWWSLILIWHLGYTKCILYECLCIYIYIYIYVYVCVCIYCTILPKVLGRPLLMKRFDYFSNFHEYKS